MTKKCQVLFVVCVPIIFFLIMASAHDIQARGKALIKVAEKTLSKYGDEGAEIAARISDNFIDEVAPYIYKIIDFVPSYQADVLLRIVDIIPESQIKRFSELCVKYPKFIDVVNTTNALKYIKKYPGHAESLYKAMKEFPGQQTMDIFLTLGRRLPSNSSEKVILELSKMAEKVGSAITKDQMISLHRVLHGKTYSSKDIDGIFVALRGNLDQKALGDLAEEMALSAVNGKRFPNKHLLDLKPGSKVIKGQHDAVHGLDLISVNSKGKPIILEVTTGKNFSQTVDSSGRVQMSPEWVLDKWNLFTKDSNNVAQLKKMGINKKYLPPNQLSEEVVKKSFDRKVIAPQSASINHIQKAGMSGLNDIVRF